MKNRKITLKDEIERIINQCDVCHVAMQGNDFPYVIPMNFGYSSDKVYLHSSAAGKKIDLLKANNKVCISFSTDHKLRWQNEDIACSYSMKYRSVLAYGSVEFISDFNEKEEALKIIMKNYAERVFSFNAPAVKDVTIFVANIEKFDGRAYGY